MAFSNDYVLLLGLTLLCGVTSFQFFTGVDKKEKSKSEMQSTQKLLSSHNESVERRIEVTPVHSRSHFRDICGRKDFFRRHYLLPPINFPSGGTRGREQSTRAPKKHVTEEKAEKKKGQIIKTPVQANIPGCEAGGPASLELSKQFPHLCMDDIMRFLIARKGDLQQASEMLAKAEAWRKANLPLKRSFAAPAVATKCFFPHGVAKDGTPVIYFRGGLYDNTKATFDVYVLAAAHAIDYALKESSEQSVTVIVHTGTVPGGPNMSADMNFIKAFVHVLSDNYPERLKRLVMFPFPWYGRALWSCVKMFVDKRTQDKVQLLSCSDNVLPKEILEFVDVEQIPTFCGGKNVDPVIDLMTTFEVD